LMTRAGDNYVSLSERAAITNRVRDCILVSIHFNEGGKTVSSGIETYYAERQVAAGTFLASWLPFLQRASSETSTLESQSLAGFIQDALVARTHAVNRGTKTEQFFVLANVHHPAVLVEGGFISNKDDVNKLGNVDYREQIAAAINDGILHYRQVLKTASPKVAE
jgi:N-acetylmuramoyl-L-alanine amidase